MKIYTLLVFLIIHSTNVVLTLKGCEQCNLNGFFVSENGYGCFLTTNETYCTCPDRTKTTNRPCRICDRQGICGPSDAICSEQSSMFASTDSTSKFACFCSSGSFKIGESCSIETTVSSSSTTVSGQTTSTTVGGQTTATTTTTTRTPTTPTTEGVTACRNRSSVKSIFLNPLLIVLFILILFNTKAC